MNRFGIGMFLLWNESITLLIYDKILVVDNQIFISGDKLDGKVKKKV